MSCVRAINRPSESPPKPTSTDRPPSDALPTESCEPHRGQALVPRPEQTASAKRERRTATKQASPKVVLPAIQMQTSHKKTPLQSSTARSWPLVLPTHHQSSGPSNDKRHLRQTVAKAEKGMHIPSKKKKNSDFSTIQAQRQQACKEKRVVPSIEHSTPDCSTDDAEDSDYLSSPAELADEAIISASNTPSKRRPRKHFNTRTNAESSAISGPIPGSSSLPSSLQAHGSMDVFKRELSTASQQSPDLEAAAMPISPSPSIWNPQLRREKYKDVDFVELPKEVYEYKKTKKEMRQRLAVKKEAMMAGRRKEKGKLAERRAIEETDETMRKIDKRKTKGEELGQIEPRKRQKSLKSSKTGLIDHSVTDDGKIPRKECQSSNTTRAPRSHKGKTIERKAQIYEAVMVKAEDWSDINNVYFNADVEARGCSFKGSEHGNVQGSVRTGAQARELQASEERFGEPHRQASIQHAQQRRNSNQDWRKSCRRREVSVPEVSRTCSCALLPEYFTRDPHHVPCLATWPGGKLEFFEHIKQMGYCPGSIHPPNVVDACMKMLRERSYPNHGDEQSLESNVEFAHGFLSANDRDDNHSVRGQSSISPPTFYGYGKSCQIRPNVGSSSRFGREMIRTPLSLNPRPSPTRVQPPNDIAPNALPVRSEVSKLPNQIARLVDQDPSSAVFDDASFCLTPPNSSPLGKRRIADIPSRFQIFDTSTTEEDNAPVRSPKAQPRTSSRHSQEQTSSNVQRPRPQSAPIDFASRKITVDGRNFAPQTAQRLHEKALGELSNNAILLDIKDMKQTLSSHKVILEHLAAAPSTQSAASQPATATAATISVTRNGAERSNSKKKKKASVAERKLKFPVLDRKVDKDLRLPDDNLIEIGRNKNHYERHVKAPYTFSWHGRLYAEYNYLLDRRDNGVPVWTGKQMKRVMRSA